MKLFRAAMLMLLLVITVQFLHYTDLMPEWANKLEPLAVRSSQAYPDGFQIKISCNDQVNDNIYIILNGRKKDVLSSEQTLTLEKGDVLEIDATLSAKSYYIKITPIDKSKMPSNWPDSIILDRYLYRFPVAK